jgi:hypothetical protein
MERNMEKEEIDILYCLIYSENPDIIIDYLNMLLSNDTLILDHQEYYSIFYSILDEHADNELVFDYVLENINRIISE